MALTPLIALLCRCTAVLLGLTCLVASAADEPIKTLILPGEAFLFEGRPSFIFTAQNTDATSSKPWVFYAPTLNGLPDVHEKWMHEQFLQAGIAVAGIDVGEGYGSPQSRELMSAFYREMTEKRGFAKRPCLLGRSRGGLWVSSWAAENTDKVAGIAGIYPVFDLRSYPAIKNAAPAYQMTPEELEQRLVEFNPIERVAKLAEAKIPACFIHGDQDTVVPLERNSAEFAARYRAAGAESLVTLVVSPGKGHDYWEGYFRCPEVIKFTIARAKAGAKPSAD